MLCKYAATGQLTAFYDEEIVNIYERGQGGKQKISGNV
jgi:hypothetical protein